MPNRIIRESILSSDRVDQLDAPAEVFYRRLLSKVDDYGRYDGRPAMLRASLFPLRLDRVREADISRWMAACQKAGLIALYSHDGKPYLECGNTDWQRRSPSRYPDPQASANICAQVLANAHLVVDVVVDEGVVVTPPPAAWFDGLDSKVVKDFTELRRAKRAPITQTAIDGIKREAAKAHLTLESVLAMCCERGWTGFKAEWLTPRAGQAAPLPNKKRELL